jgi:hypothetical protein
VPAPAPPVVCSDAIIPSLFRQRALGPGVVVGGVLHWSAILVALVTLNCFIAPAVAEPEFIPGVPAGLLPGAEALAVVCPAVLLADALPFAAEPS